MRRQGRECARVDYQTVRDLEVAQFRRQRHVPHHRSAHERGLTALCVCGIENLLDSVHVAGEARYDHAPGGGAEDLLDRRGEFAFGSGEPWYVRVRGIDEQKIHPFFTESGEAA